MMPGEDGFSLTRWVRARAGVAVGTLYNHFKDRDALLAGLLDQRAGEVLGEMDRVIAEEARADFRERLTTLLRTMFTYFAAHRPFFTIFQQAESADLRALYPVAGKKVPELGLEVYGRLEKLMKSGVRGKALRPEGAELYTALIMSMLRVNKIRERCSSAGAGGPAITPEQLVRVFLDGAGA